VCEKKGGEENYVHFISARGRRAGLYLLFAIKRICRKHGEGKKKKKEVRREGNKFGLTAVLGKKKPKAPLQFA